jgi:hypothetical protein
MFAENHSLPKGYVVVVFCGELSPQLIANSSKWLLTIDSFWYITNHISLRTIVHLFFGHF